METILVVDDEAQVLSKIQMCLQDQYRIVTAPDGTVAMEVLGKELPSVVITDLKMPDIDGIELMKRIKETSGSTEVIMLTGYADMESAVASMRLGAADYLVKPIDADALERAIEGALQKRARKAKKAGPAEQGEGSS